MKTEKIDRLPDTAVTHFQRTGRPWVTLSYAQSLDGCIAAQPGQPFAVSDSPSLTLTHQLRAAHDAILVGIGTVLADNPRLNVRLVSGHNPQPVVVDSRLRFPPEANLLQQPPFPWIATTRQANPHRPHALESAGARVLRLPSTAQGQVSLIALLEELGSLGIKTLMVEGGAGIITAFLAGQLVDYFVLTIAPIFLGGLHAVNKLEHFPRLGTMRCEQLGADLVLAGHLQAAVYEVASRVPDEILQQGGVEKSLQSKIQNLKSKMVS